MLFPYFISNSVFFQSAKVIKNSKTIPLEDKKAVWRSKKMKRAFTTHETGFQKNETPFH
jgi:hypothetical protein